MPERQRPPRLRRPRYQEPLERPLPLRLPHGNQRPQKQCKPNRKCGRTSTTLGSFSERTTCFICDRIFSLGIESLSRTQIPFTPFLTSKFFSASTVMTAANLI